MATHDVIVVGARCAGAALAMLLARKGHRVLALDRAEFPSDTMSTHFMPPRTTGRLSSWGILGRLAATGCPLIETITFDMGRARIRGQPDSNMGATEMYCPRRRVLDYMLVTAAREAGAEVREKTVVRHLVWKEGRVVGVQSETDDGAARTDNSQIVVGADGLWSRVAREVGSEPRVRQVSLSCAYYTYWENLPSDGVEFYRRKGKVILLFPTHDNLSCLYVGLPHAESSKYQSDVKSTYLAALDDVPTLAGRMRFARQAEPFKGTNKLPNHQRQSFGPGWALVGDAAQHRDPITGMGIGDAFLGADLLADAISEGLTGQSTWDAALTKYQDCFRNQTADIFEYTVRSAELPDLDPLIPFYEAISKDLDATRQLMNVIAGNSSFNTLFGKDSIQRIMSASAA
jgi:flavin-dependent dehydrogenase